MINIENRNNSYRYSTNSIDIEKAHKYFLKPTTDNFFSIIRDIELLMDEHDIKRCQISNGKNYGLDISFYKNDDEIKISLIKEISNTYSLSANNSVTETNINIINYKNLFEIIKIYVPQCISMINDTEIHKKMIEFITFMNEHKEYINKYYPDYIKTN